MKKLNRRHLRRPIRLKGYNYAQPGSYFVTICTYGRFPIFGKIENGQMHLSPLGQIAFDEWQRTPIIRPNVSLGAFVIMPDHIHGIITINKKFITHITIPAVGTCCTRPMTEWNIPKTCPTHPTTDWNIPKTWPTHQIKSGYPSPLPKPLEPSCADTWVPSRARLMKNETPQMPKSGKEGSTTKSSAQNACTPR